MSEIAIASLVEYEQHGKPILALVLGKTKSKWQLLNQSGAELELPENRLYPLPGKLPEGCADKKGKLEFLSKLSGNMEPLFSEIDLSQLWELILEELEEASISELTELAFGSDGLLEHLAMRRRLIASQPYFKRKKDLFVPRPAEVVEQLIRKSQVEEEKNAKKDAVVDAVLKSARIKSVQGKELSVEERELLRPLEELAALGKEAQNYDFANSVLEAALEASKLKLSGTAQVKAFKLLV